jgi:type IV pilus assembly protein PilN
MLRFNFAESRGTKIRKSLLLDLALVLIILSIFVIGIKLQISILDRQIYSLEEGIRDLKSERLRLKKVEAEEKQLIEKEKILKAKLKVISELEERRKVPGFLYYFGDRKNLISGVWLDSLDQKGKALVLKGSSFNLKLISRFLANVERDLGKVIFKNTKLVSEKMPGGEVKYYKFQFTVEMK